MTDPIPAKMAEELRKVSVNLAYRQTISGSYGGTLENARSLLSKRKLLQPSITSTPGAPKSTIAEGSKALLTAWKVWQLISPRRMFKYNLRNLTGDSDAAFVGNPRASLSQSRLYLNYMMSLSVTSP